MKAYNPNSTRIDHNYFRSPPDPNYIQSLGLPVITMLWSLRDRLSIDNPDIVYSHLSSLIGFLIGIFTHQDLGQDIMDVAYFNNPWETWVYSVGGTPDSGGLSWT